MSMKQKNSHSTCRTSESDATRLKMDLVCQYQFENGSSQFVFLDLGNGDGAARVKHSLFSESFVQILASSNGFLLLSAYKEDQLCYCLFNSLTRLSTIIPQPCIDHILRVGLASDDQCHFHVVLVAASSSSSSSFNPIQLELLIFSSDTGNWRKHPHPINLSLDSHSLPELKFQELQTPPLYSNGAIYWEIAGHLLVYQNKTRKHELHQLPNFFEDWSWQSTLTYRRSLCESKGCVYYCYTDFDGFHIWDLLKENDHRGFYFGPFYDPKKYSWRLVHSVRHEILTSKHQNLFGNSEPYMNTPIAYSEHDHTLYLQIPGGVVSYNLDTENLRSVCSYSYPDMNFNCCLFLPFVASGMCNMQREEEVEGDREMELNLPLSEAETFSF